jgi:hypothetical protein
MQLLAGIDGWNNGLCISALPRQLPESSQLRFVLQDIVHDEPQSVILLRQAGQESDSTFATFGVTSDEYFNRDDVDSALMGRDCFVVRFPAYR